MSGSFTHVTVPAAGSVKLGEMVVFAVADKPVDEPAYTVMVTGFVPSGSSAGWNSSNVILCVMVGGVEALSIVGS